MREKLLDKWGELSYRRAGTILAVVIAVTVILLAITPPLGMTTRWVDMLPEHDPMTIEFNNIIEKFSSASNIVVVVKGEEDRIKSFADRLAPQVEQLTQWVRRVDYRFETDFMADHGFMLVKAKDLKDQVDIYRDLNLIPLLTAINDNFEKEYIEDDQSLSSREKEDNAIRYLDGLAYWLSTMKDYVTAGTLPAPDRAEGATDRFLIGDPYYIDIDKNMLLIFIHPNFPVTETDRSIECTNHIDSMVSDLLLEYSDVEAGLTGTFTLVRDEMDAMTIDMFLTTFIALILILVLFVVSFRIWTAPLLAGITLIMGIIWASIFAALTVQTLNLMTSMFAVVLAGLGIDFSIHIISLYTELRSAKMPGAEAMRATLTKAGPGVITGALTTACAFLTLMISDSRGMSEFGLVAGGGLIACMLSAMILLPALLALRDRIMEKRSRRTVIAGGITFASLGTTAKGIARRPRLILVGGLVVTIAAGWLASRLTFDYNYLNMEPEGLVSIILQDEMIDAFNISPDFILVTAGSVDEARELTTRAKDYKSVGMVESISEYIPSTQEQQARRGYLEQIRQNLVDAPAERPLSSDDLSSLTEQIDRLGMNIIELADMAFLGGQDRVDHKATTIIGKAEDTLSPNLVDDIIAAIESDPEHSAERLNHFQIGFIPSLKAKALRMAGTDSLTLESIPPSIVEKFIDADRENFLVTIYPDEQVWDFEYLTRLTDQMMRVSDRITGTPPLFLRMMAIIGSEGMRATLLALAVVFVLLMIDFRSFRFALIAMIPLVIGSILMLGLLKLFGQQLTFMNVMAVPLIVGIGIDDGVHVLHRYRREGPGSIALVMRSTGRAVLITSLTTMIAFGSFIFATYRGLGSMGTLLFLGVGSCFLATFIILTAIITLTERKKG